MGYAINNKGQAPIDANTFNLGYAYVNAQDTTTYKNYPIDRPRGFMFAFIPDPYIKMQCFYDSSTLCLYIRYAWYGVYGTSPWRKISTSAI